MKWSEFLTETSERSGVSVAVARRVISAAVSIVEEQLASKEAVRIPGLGTFNARWMRGRTLRSVSSGRRTSLDGRYVARFSPAAGLKQRLMSLTPQHWRDPRHQSARRTAKALIGDLELYHGHAIPGALRADRLDDADARCSDSFGEAWSRARDTYRSRVDPEVAGTRDYLIDEAVQRWSKAG